MAYKVLKSFSDLQDKQHVYVAGDIFPRPGFSVSEKRVKELQGSDNAFGFPIIGEKIPEKAEIAPKQDDDRPKADTVKETTAKPVKAQKRAKKPV